MSEDTVLLRCDICRKVSNRTTDRVLFGDWMERSDLRVHYFCLLLSTNLQQRGKTDRSGILGFLLRDIRAEIVAAGKRICCYCDQTNAHIECSRCRESFHMVCGRRGNCVHQFCGDFRTFCGQCLPLTDFQRQASLHSYFGRCFICYLPMGTYTPVKFIYAACCNSGYVHRYCMQRYALAAGFYLRCIWCRSTEFREHVRRWGIFVPDREAQWELEEGAYRDLHRGHARCDMEQCLCPRGRFFFSGKLKWALILCDLCGSVGAHNSTCIPGVGEAGPPITTFKCSTCAETEENVVQRRRLLGADSSDVSIDSSVYMTKEGGVCTENDCTDDDGQAVVSSKVFSPLSLVASATLAVEKYKLQQTESAAPQLAPPATNDDPPPYNFDEMVSELCKVQQQSVQPAAESTPPEDHLLSPRVLVLEESCDEEAASSLSHDEGNMATFELFRFDSDSNCLGTTTVRINLASPRFQGKALQQIQSELQLLRSDDIVENNEDVGVFAGIDRIIHEYTD